MQLETMAACEQAALVGRKNFRELFDRAYAEEMSQHRGHLLGKILCSMMPCIASFCLTHRSSERLNGKEWLAYLDDQLRCW